MRRVRRVAVDRKRLPPAGFAYPPQLLISVRWVGIPNRETPRKDIPEDIQLSHYKASTLDVLAGDRKILRPSRVRTAVETPSHKADSGGQTGRIGGWSARFFCRGPQNTLRTPRTHRNIDGRLFLGAL